VLREDSTIENEIPYPLGDNEYIEFSVENIEKEENVNLATLLPAYDQ
jgi:hypothetical protein